MNVINFGMAALVFVPLPEVGDRENPEGGLMIAGKAGKADADDVGYSTCIA